MRTRYPLPFLASAGLASAGIASVIRAGALLAVFAAVFAAVLAPMAAAGERMTPELLWKLGRVGDGDISPDGAQVVYTVRNFDLAQNKGTTDVHVLDLASAHDRTVAQALPSVSGPQWVATPAGLRIFLVTKQGGDDATPQVWSLDPASGTLDAVTAIEGGLGNLKVSPSGTHIAFTVDVKVRSTVNELYPDLPKADARIIDSLLYRHWNEWDDFKVSHVHVAPIGSDGKAGEVIDLMKGLEVDCPVPPFGGPEEFAWSPDGKEIALTMKVVGNPAESTDTDIYVVPADGKGRIRNITTGMNGYDKEPVYSPDGSTIAFLSMARPGFEADRNRIFLHDRASGQNRELTAGLDQMAHTPRFSPDGASIFFNSEWLGTEQLFRISVATGGATQITQGPHDFDIRDVSDDGKTLLVGRQDMVRPHELYTLPATGGEGTRVTNVNDALYANIELPTVQERYVRASDGKKIHNWVIYPPGFDPAKKYPMLTYCQGGPQGQVSQFFSYRWNFHLMAAHDYIVLAVNRRGLPGFGQAWNDQISGDWGGQAMQDILAAHDDLLTEPYIDAAHCAAVGASFGGYTVYWLMGNAAERFATMVAHAGVFDLESMYGTTEELFFVNHDLGGPYWRSARVQAEYDRFSPHRFIGNWRTPLLVIHGEKDFRVPVSQGMEAFTAAKVQGIPSRFLYFPGEGHWVQGAQNGVLWHRVFFDWVDRWCKPPATVGAAGAPVGAAAAPAGAAAAPAGSPN